MASIASKNAKNKSKSKSKSKERLSLSELKTLGHQLLSSRAHINNLPILLSHVSPTSPPPHALESLLSLHSFFAPILSDLPSSKPSSTNHRDDDPELIYNTWVRSKFDIFVNSLIDFAASPLADETLKEVVLDTMMEFVKVANGGRFHSAIYHRLLHAIVHSTVPVNFVVDLLVSKYFKYIDVRYFTYISLEKLARTLEEKDISDHGDLNADSNDEGHSKSSLEIFIHNIHYVISHIPPLEGSDEKSDFEMWSRSGGDSKELSGNPKAEDKQLHTEKNKNNVLSAAKIAKKMKLKFTKAWISFLRLQLPLDVYKEVLVTLHQAVIPYLSNPIMLCDFLTRSYDIGGVVSVMALSSLFILMTQYGLEYPNFYEKLYALLVPSIFMAKHRAKFFQLLDSCLKSTLLPAYLAAAFAKKLSRLSLSVPASGALVIIALIHNLLRRHPSINCLVHREVQEETAKETDADMSSRKLGIDHFDNEESNPIKSKAMKSSLWEIDTLRHHYCPAVSRFVLSLENDLTVRAKTTEMTVQDFSSGSYATIFGDEIRRRVKQVPLAFYKATPTSLFSESDFLGWTFKHDGKETIDGNDEKQITNISDECDNSSAKRQRVENS